MTATNLFIKRAHGQSIESVTTFEFSPQGAAGNIRCSPLRQVLITSQPISDEFGIEAGELRENIIVSFPRLYELPSGTVTFSVTDQKYETIPYAVKDRVRWLLSKGNAPTATSDLLHSLGLPSAYARALPRMIETIGLANLLMTVIKPD